MGLETGGMGVVSMVRRAKEKVHRKNLLDTCLAQDQEDLSIEKEKL